MAKSLYFAFDPILFPVGKIPSRLPGVGNTYEDTGKRAVDKIFALAYKSGRTTAFIDLKVQFYEGEGSFMGIGWQRWSDVYTIDSLTRVRANPGFLDGYTFTSGTAALNRAIDDLNDTVYRGLLPHNKYRK